MAPHAGTLDNAYWHYDAAGAVVPRLPQPSWYDVVMLRVQTGIGHHEGFKASQHSLGELLKMFKCWTNLERSDPTSK
jgi:hypothetical protein